MLESILESAGKQKGHKTPPEISRASDLISPRETRKEDEDSNADYINRILVDAVLKSCGDTPTVLFFDDLQWADDASLELMPRLAMDVSSRKVSILATCRDDELPRNQRLTPLCVRASPIVTIRRLPGRSIERGRIDSGNLRPGTGKRTRCRHFTMPGSQWRWSQGPRVRRGTRSGISPGAPPRDGNR